MPPSVLVTADPRRRLGSRDGWEFEYDVQSKLEKHMRSIEDNLLYHLSPFYGWRRKHKPIQVHEAPLLDLMETWEQVKVVNWLEDEFVVERPGIPGQDIMTAQEDLAKSLRAIIAL